MKRFYLRTAVILLVLICASQAFALTTETRNDQNSDGSSKFADPDDKKPAFMINSDGNGGATVAPQSSGFSSVTLPAVGDMTQGARAFDQTLSRQQNK